MAYASSNEFARFMRSEVIGPGTHHTKAVGTILQDLSNRDPQFLFIKAAFHEFLHGKLGLEEARSSIGSLYLAGPDNSREDRHIHVEVTFNGVRDTNFGKDQHLYVIFDDILNTTIYELLDRLDTDITPEEAQKLLNLDRKVELLDTLHRRSISIPWREKPVKSDSSAKDSGQKNEYRYSSRLDSTKIRVLHIQPGLKESPIECKLEIRCLNNDKIEEALSYVWSERNSGKPIFDKEIKIYESQFRITTNLDKILRYLRDENNIRTMWVDAICINQSDLEEKAHQIGLMREIYSKAQTTTIWLDDGLAAQEGLRLCPTDEPGDNFNLLPEEFGEMINEYNLEAILETFYKYGKDSTWNERKIKVTTTLLRCLNTIMTHQWIELYLLELYKNGVDDQIVKRLRPENSEASTLSDIKNRRLQTLLSLVAHYRASDPRDKIFALESLQLRSDGRLIKVDYINQSVEDVFQRITARCLSQELILAAVCYDLFEGEKTPSWVLDFTYSNARRQTTPLGQQNLQGFLFDFNNWQPIWKTSLPDESLSERVVCFATPKTLFCSGISVGVINFAAVVPDLSEGTFQDLKKFLAEFNQRVREELRSVTVDNVSIPDKHVRQSIDSEAEAGVKTGIPNMSFPTDEEMVKFATLGTGIQERGSKSGGEEEEIAQSAMFLILIGGIAGRYLFATKNGIVGLATAPIQKGDTFAIIHKYPNYVILRGVKEQGGELQDWEKSWMVARAAVMEDKDKMRDRVENLPKSFFQIITISDDRSCGSEFDRKKRILSALSRPAADKKAQLQGIWDQTSSNTKPKGASIQNIEGSYVVSEGQTNSPLTIGAPLVADSSRARSSLGTNYALDDYQKQLMLLEMENKKRLMMERENVDMLSHRSPIMPSVDDALRVVMEALKMPSGSSLTIDTLREYASKIDVEPRVQLIYRVSQNRGKKMYLDPPQWLGGANSSKEAIVGNLHIPRVSSYLSNHPEIVCVVYRDYDSSDQRAEDSDDEDSGAGSVPKHSSESIELISKEIIAGVDAFCDYFKFDMDGVASTKASILSSPYLPIFHTKGNNLNSFLGTLENTQRQHLQLLLDYILTEYRLEHELVNEMTKKGKITYKCIKYLFKPGGVVVQGNHQNSRGYLCTAWPREGQLENGLNLEVQHWEFDGAFSRKETKLVLPIDIEDLLEKEIDDLDIRPVEFVNESTKERLRRRGGWFWKCRIRHIVSYHEENERGVEDSGHARYIIDMKMYRELHKRGEDSTQNKGTDDLGPEALKQNDPPNDKFVYLMPLTIKGYNLKRKKWLELEVDKIGPVVWNKQAFKNLVMKERTKSLIQALISNQIEAENSTDLIPGKGNGLIMLLHGGPGTGKTLTAESVAEIAEKPLYPVTCGDIGIEPEDVENYLESVLHIGKTWGCVVLLDEAEVFLEQRGLEDLRRNALVSVFLRVLEYYDGILILTSNRVGTFDEAFKSRIQLALHYENLTEYQRTQIWNNFISRLKEINEEGIHFDDLKDNIENLAKHELNGREIRNTITTARQYARWQRQQPHGQSVRLNYKMMSEVIETAGEFNRYIKKLNHGRTHDQLAKEDGVR
ncbi:hypothetical protein GQX73_g6025 [Xylaria multiplex]|uniref:AAA+ ATPase domain-containing protein n=1 Tax=Xylaria multiplex TaxID=323545 RepID=A0A7C8N3M4_9PEZI|nr:hypothetical protein GQX73_g6025 [Xylaria multiplex]